MPAKIYKTKDGKRVPSTTTITNRFKDSGGLIHWAWSLGMDGVDYRQAREAAANAGTIAHGMIEKFLHDEKPDEAIPYGASQDVIAHAQKGYESFQQWWKGANVTVHATEVSLVSEEYSYGGTLDCILSDEHGLIVGDWKTANSVYPEMLLQLAAYVLLYRENFEKDAGRAYLFRFDKEYGSFAHHAWDREVLDIALDTFLTMRQLYGQMAQIKRLVG